MKKPPSLYALAGIIVGMVYLGLMTMIAMIIGFLNMLLHWRELNSTE